MEKIENFNRLLHIYELYGNCPETGYLKEAKEIQYEKDGEVYFKSINTGEKETTSEGVVLPNSIVIKQVTTNGKKTENHIYIWDDNQDDDKKKYTYIEFDKEDSMKECFNTIRSQKQDINHSDIAETLKGMGINFENITQILTSQILNPLDEMLKDEDQDADKPTLTM